MLKKLTINDLTVEVTQRCNMKCRHCLRGDTQDVDIFLSDIDGLLNQTEAIGQLIITGGEPTLNLSAIQHIANGLTIRGIPLMRFQIITNGLCYDERLVTIIKRFAEIIQVTRKFGYGDVSEEPWRVQLGVSLDRFHESPEICRSNYLRYKSSLKGIAEVRKILHGNAPLNVGRAESLRNTIDHTMIYSTCLLQQVETLSFGSYPVCGYCKSYNLERLDQRIVACGLYLTALGDILPSVVCDSDYQYHGVRICGSWDDIWEEIAKYNAENDRIHCPEADDYRLKIKLLMPEDQRKKEEALLTAKEAQDEPSAAPPPITGKRAMRAKPDEYPEIVKAAAAHDYLRYFKA